MEREHGRGIPRGKEIRRISDARMAYTYILKTKDGSYYIGSTNDIKLRILQHQNGQVPSTKYRRPLEPIFVQEFLTKSDAQTFEYRIKNWKSRKLIESLINKSKENIISTFTAPSSIG